ncbi:hypothetical protein [Sinorhizobium psoraleae]|uniref:Uncharacterized protein n=1 Tax=Sinorhizobium psoraleae TaxID=520838 RepID=A0ABT4KBI6_9HYPH|nr:hypothetical protein [Sinorhizobium psoraleae]MCZ4089332.1 hypothetical protein [Sinorhizobium psoraleae]
MEPEQARVVAIFKNHPQINQAKSQKEGRPIYDDMEIVEVRFAANRQTVGVFPAHSFAGWRMTPEGIQEQYTYAMKFPDQYRRFKANQQQVAHGTPVEELPFLTAAKRLELKALSIYTAEALAALDGQELKNLGIGGRELKNQAQAFIDAASGTANVTKMAAENEALRQQVEEMRREMQEFMKGARTPGASQPAAKLCSSPIGTMT